MPAAFVIEAHETAYVCTYCKKNYMRQVLARQKPGHPFIVKTATANNPISSMQKSSVKCYFSPLYMADGLVTCARRCTTAPCGLTASRYKIHAPQKLLDRNAVELKCTQSH